MRICKLDTTSQIWGSGPVAGVDIAVPSIPSTIETFTITPDSPSGPRTTTTVQIGAGGQVNRTSETAPASGPSTCGAGCCADGTGWQ